MTPQREDRVIWLAVTAFLIILALLVFSLGRAHAQATQCIANVSAQGTPDAITSSALPCGTTTNLVLLSTSGANVTTTPTYQPIGSPALPILRADGTALLAGDLQASYVALLSSTGTSWVLLNPYNNRSSAITIGATGVTGGSDGCLLERSGILLGCLVPGNGVATALGVNVGSPGAFVVNGGALGVPSGGTATNLVGLPILTGVSGLGGGVATALGIAPNTLGGIATWPVAGGVANVTNVTSPPYNADPTGILDSTAGINAAITAATTNGTCVYIPTGTYKITDALTMPALAGCLFGDGQFRTKLAVTSGAFNLSALGVLVLPNTSGGAGSRVRDLWISFSQPDAASRAGLVQFPPGIYMQGAGRTLLDSIQISQAITCIDARGNAGGVMISDVNCGGLSYGLRMDGALDSVHVTNWHEWDFGMDAAMLLLYKDGTNICFEFGRIDGLTSSGDECFSANVVWTANAANSAGSQMITGISLDSSEVLQNGAGKRGNFITDSYFARNATLNLPDIVVNAGSLTMTNYSTQASIAVGSAPSVQVTGGNLDLRDGILGGLSPLLTVQAATVTGGQLTIEGSNVNVVPSLAVPFVEQIGGALAFHNNYVPRAVGGSGTKTAVQFDIDDTNNAFFGNSLNGWGWVPPATMVAGGGFYGPVLFPPTDATSMQITSPGEAPSLINAPVNSQDLAFGNRAGRSLVPVAGQVSGFNNTLVGFNAGQNAVSSNGMTAFGSGACRAATTQNNATCIGANAGAAAGGGSGCADCTSIGNQALFNATGNQNTALGEFAGHTITTGTNNTMVGQGVGSTTLTTGSHDVFIGTGASCAADTASESDVFRLCASSGSTPLLLGGLASGALSLQVNGPIYQQGFEVPEIIGQTAIPFILAPTGTMADNGVLTLGTALDSTYTKAYVFLPLNAISAGSAAGWYYATGSSTTAFTVFNNTYTIGVPVIPGSPTPFVTTGPGAYTGSIGSTNAVAISIPGNSLGVNGKAVAEWSISFVGSTNSKSFASSYGSLSLGTSATTTVGNIQMVGQSSFANRGQTGAQVVTSVTGGGLGTQDSAPTFGTVNSTSAQTFTFKISDAVATEYVILQAASLKVYPGL